MKILFVMRHPGYVRNFESTLRLLCERDHTVHLAFQSRMRHWLLDAPDTAQQVAAEYPNFTHGMAPGREDGWGLLGRQLRRTLDYLRYLAPEYRAASKLRRRAERDADAALVRMAQRGRVVRWCLARALRIMDRSIPRSAEVDRFIDEHRPDLLLVTPLVERGGSPQSDYVRSARARGVRTVFCVASWDNLTNKGLIHEHFDLVTVWNEAMKQEAVELHGVPPDRVAVTGAQPFDDWFGWQPSTSREAFCARVGLSPDRPYLLYLCSSTFVAPREASFVRTWVQQLRGASSEMLRRAGVLVRPHPQNAAQWRRFDMSGFTNVAVYPPLGAAPVDAGSRAAYFDSIYHSAAVVGINTTAEIESAIVGRDVYTLLAPEFRETQKGTLHFHHLLVNDGLLHVAETFADHAAQLDAALRAGGADADGRCRRFVEAFVRPNGIDVPATGRLVEALEGLGARPEPRPDPTPVWAPLARFLLRPLAARARREGMAASAAKTRRAKAKKKQHALITRRRKARAEERARMLVATPNEQPANEAVPAPSEVSPAPPQGARTPGKGARSLAELVQAFQALAYSDRRRFVRANVEHIPAELWLKMQSSKAQRLDYEPVEIMLRVTSRRERKRLRACAKEPFTVAWIERMFDAGDVFYDIGANVGAYALIAAKKLSGAARVFAFEPSLVNLSALYNNIALNKLTSEITPLPIALSNANGLGRFNLRDLEPGSGEHMLEAASLDGPTPYAQPAITYRLDDLIALLDLPLPNHIKLDVDGCEMAVLEGATQTLESPALQSILVEANMELSESVATFIQARGLKMSWRARIRSKSGVYRVWYGVFVRGREGPLDLPTQPAAEVVA